MESIFVNIKIHCNGSINSSPYFRKYGFNIISLFKNKTEFTSIVPMHKTMYFDSLIFQIGNPRNKNGKIFFIFNHECFF